MNSRKFSQGHGDGPAQEACQGEAQDDGWTSHFHRRSRAQQEAGSDRPADSHHGHLTGAELVSESAFLATCVLGSNFGLLAHIGTYIRKCLFPKDLVQWMTFVIANGRYFIARSVSYS